MREIGHRAAFHLRTLPVRPRRRDRPRLFGLLSFRDEMRFLPGWFASNAHQLDGVIAYDDGSSDGSAEFVAAQPSVLELVRKPRGASDAWDEPAIHAELIAAAGRHDADWLVAVDADERLEEEFGERARREIVRLSRRGVTAASVRVRELWDAPDQYRSDGLWGNKRPARLFAWRPDPVLDPRPVHGHWAPVNSFHWGIFRHTELTIYHLRMVRAADREARRRRYETADPHGEYQSIGYAYLTDATGLELTALPDGRGYRPLHRDPEIAVVVIGVGNPPELVGAVDSVLAQGVAAEVVVVNTGGGHAAATLADRGVRVIETPEVRYVGGARNLGVAASQAPIVAFLAADCRAEPGWLAARLAAHNGGHLAVASSLTNGAPRGIVSWASYGLLSVNRMPTLSADQALRYGVSYTRSLLEAVGPFREDLRTGEDTEYHDRLPPGCEIAWIPAVRTAHMHPTTVRGLMTEQYARGERFRAEWWHLWGEHPHTVAVRQVAGLPRRAARAVRHAEPGTRARLVASTPLMLAGGLGYAMGAWRGPR